MFQSEQMIYGAKQFYRLFFTVDGMCLGFWFFFVLFICLLGGGLQIFLLRDRTKSWKVFSLMITSQLAFTIPLAKRSSPQKDNPR